MTNNMGVLIIIMMIINFVAQLVQVELVMVILRRLAEDIHIYESGLDQRRKKEMATALNEKIQDVFCFILKNLEV